MEKSKIGYGFSGVAIRVDLQGQVVDRDIFAGGWRTSMKIRSIFLKDGAGGEEKRRGLGRIEGKH